MSTDWKTICADKKARQEASIPPAWRISLPPDEQQNVLRVPSECGILEPHEITITETDVRELLEKLATGKWTALDVTRAFYKRAIIAHQLTNCLTEIFVDQALARAAALDAHLKKTGKVIGPLHGLPVSLKDQVAIKGLETVMGYASWVGQVAEKDAALITILYNLGAVPFVRTNLPQTVMFPETFNHVFGRTINPHNRKLTPGGSSGGEGALLALRGSPLGIGTDIGGSVRFPASFCGLYGLRPSNRRIPYLGLKNSLEGQESILSSIGPLAHDIFALKLFLKTIVGARPWTVDPLALRMPWDEAGYGLSEHGGGESLCFGVIWDDGNTLPYPPVRRALDMVTQAVVNAGHKIIVWKPHKHQEICENSMSIYFAGAVQDFGAHLAPCGEPPVSSMRPQNENENENAQREPERPPPYLPNGIQSLSAYELWQAHKARAELRKEYLDHWNATAAVTGTGRPVDALISPVAPYPAPPHGECRHPMYTVVWSTLDYPALTIPVTTVDPILDAPVPRDSFLSSEDQILHETYSVETYKAAPVGVQIVGRTHEDEALLRIGEIVDEALKKSLRA